MIPNTPPTSDPMLEAARNAAREGKAKTININGQDYFIFNVQNGDITDLPLHLEQNIEQVKAVARVLFDTLNADAQRNNATTNREIVHISREGVTFRGQTNPGPYNLNTALGPKYVDYLRATGDFRLQEQVIALEQNIANGSPSRVPGDFNNFPAFKQYLQRNAPSQPTFNKQELQSHLLNYTKKLVTKVYRGFSEANVDSSTQQEFQTFLSSYNSSSLLIQASNNKLEGAQGLLAKHLWQRIENLAGPFLPSVPRDPAIVTDTDPESIICPDAPDTPLLDTSTQGPFSTNGIHLLPITENFDARTARFNTTHPRPNTANQYQSVNANNHRTINTEDDDLENVFDNDEQFYSEAPQFSPNDNSGYRSNYSTINHEGIDAGMEYFTAGLPTTPLGNTGSLNNDALPLFDDDQANSFETLERVVVTESNSRRIEQGYQELQRQLNGFTSAAEPNYESAHQKLNQFMQTPNAPFPELGADEKQAVKNAQNAIQTRPAQMLDNDNSQNLQRLINELERSSI